MSVSTAPGGPPVVDPKDVQLNASRLSHMSTSSTGSAVTLGGVDYPVGSRVGKTGAFVIGDPRSFDPHGRSFTSLNSSQAGSGKGLVHATAIEEKGYTFEDWNWPVIRLSCLVLMFAVMIALLAAVIGVCIEHRMYCDSPFEWYQGSTMYHIQNQPAEEGSNLTQSKSRSININIQNIEILSNIAKTQIFNRHLFPLISPDTRKRETVCPENIYD